MQNIATYNQYQQPEKFSAQSAGGMGGFDSEKLHTRNMETNYLPASTYFAVLLAALLARYLPRSISYHLDNVIKASEDAPVTTIPYLNKIIKWSKGSESFVNNVSNTDLLTQIPALLYDASMGVGSLYITHDHSEKIKQDITNLFAETVAYEIAKKPTDITYNDLKQSTNKMVQATLENAADKRLWRYATDALFFGKTISLAVANKVPSIFKENWGEFALGSKGVMLFKDISSRKETDFENLLKFADSKLNPMKGIGDKITASDIIDIYQKYNSNHNPDLFLKDSGGEQNNVNWQKSNVIFGKIADLMNDTYKYKHSPNIQLANFALPEFIHLLGHDMINLQKPEESLAYIEVANSYGIDKVNMLHNALQHGEDLNSALNKMGMEEITVNYNRFFDRNPPLNKVNNISYNQPIYNHAIMI